MQILPDPSEKWELPKELLTDERLEQARIEQMSLAERVNSPYSNRTPQDIQRFNAGILIAETEKMLEAVPKLPDVAREQYAEALAEQGYFQKASEVTKDKDKRKLYKDLFKAVLKDDSETCKCTGKHLYAESDVWSQKHGKRMPVIRCNNCGHRNVRALPHQIAKDRDMRKLVRSHASGRTPSDAKQIIEELLK